MKCSCDYCGGTGRVSCYECGGQGEWEGGIETIKLDRCDKHFEELSELQRDARRVNDQAKRLKELRPHRAQSYDEQLEATLVIINHQADELSKKK
jgi:hypothetical protein